MSTNSPKCPVHKPNKNRSVAKLKRGFGELAMKKENMTQPEWTQKHDPLFKVKKNRK